MFGMNIVKKQRVRVAVQRRLARVSPHAAKPHVIMSLRDRQMEQLRKWAFEGIVS